MFRILFGVFKLFTGTPLFVAPIGGIGSVSRVSLDKVDIGLCYSSGFHSLGYPVTLVSKGMFVYVCVL